MYSRIPHLHADRDERSISPNLPISPISRRSVARRERDVQQHLAVSPRISPYHAEPYSSRCERHLPISPHEPQSHTTIYRSRRDPHLAVSPHTSRYLPISRVTLSLITDAKIGIVDIIIIIWARWFSPRRNRYVNMVANQVRSSGERTTRILILIGAMPLMCGGTRHGGSSSAVEDGGRVRGTGGLLDRIAAR